jgi:predicted enzyme related to lactoylglutathione lyase
MLAASRAKGAEMAGRIVHVELPARDTARATEFWSSLMGWQFEPMGGPFEYHMFQGEPGGAVYPSQSGERGPVVYYGTEDIDADVARIRELGGQAEDKQPVPTHGWFASCVDTEGNHFSLWQNDPNAG